MNTADTLSNDRLVEEYKKWQQRKRDCDRTFYDLKKEFDKRLNVEAILEGQQTFQLPFSEIIEPEEVK